jgi:anti-sigma factor RsiW
MKERESICQAKQTELVAYLDQELSKSERHSLQAHLETCAACRAELDELRASLGAVDSLPATEASSLFQAEFWERFESEKQLESGWFARLKPARLVWALGSAAAACALVLTLVMWPGTTQQSLPIGADELAIADQLDLFADYEVLEQLPLLEDLDVIEALDDV